MKFVLRSVFLANRATINALFVQQCNYCQSAKQHNVVKSQISPISVPNTSLHEFILNKIDRWPDRTAVICSETRRHYTFGQSDTLSFNLAQALCAKFGFKNGDVIAVMLPNVTEYIITYLGLFKAGIIVSPINPIFTPDETARQLKDSNAKAIITLTSSYSVVESAIKKLGLNQNAPKIITIQSSASEAVPRGSISFTELCQYGGPHVKLYDATADDVCVIAYSSGTTGLPKGVKLLHRNLVANLMQVQHECININHETTISHQDTIPIITPFYHCYGMIPVLFNMFSQGGKGVLLAKYRPDLFLSMLEKFPGQIIHLVPPILLMMSNNEFAKKKLLDRMRHVVVGAAPLAASDLERFQEKFGHQMALIQMYGLTEAGPVTHGQRRDKEVILGSIGWNLSSIDCRIVSTDDESTNLGPNQSGHMLVRGPNIMDGYLNNAAATAEAIDADGWLKTGDVCHYDEAGQFFVTDRIKDLIKVKGNQVAPAELEALIREHPDVTDAGVIGVSHAQHGEVPRAFVVPRKGSHLRCQHVEDFVKEKAAKYKQLTGGVVLVDSIPKNPSGKILRRLLKDL